MFQTIKKYPYIVDIIILAAIFSISIVEYTHICFSFYSAGAKNSDSFVFLILLFLYESVKIIIVILAVRILLHKTNHMNIRKPVITALLAILVFIGSWILPFTIGQPGAVYFLKGYEKWVMKNVEIDKIQEWLVSGEADKYMNERYVDNFPDDLPDFITSFNPRYIFFNDQESDRGKSIEFLPGGSALGHHGIVIGLPTIKNIQEYKVIVPDGEVEFRRQIQPGVFIFDGG